ncbi:hypothetical protein K8O68_07045 [Salipaludibacillus sp. CUR1]|uniref:hypothetical protein n=1 Tax=Salipaludibacillus sp. CUR1 TaxID=2820003 RepID=UPI001E449013|nr:hypothetical protein [Salipaludibacillus sp. CUR1]MCE7792180.1 hypothetical protein [Salipaludibacillus sp. CUR1]
MEKYKRNIFSIILIVSIFLIAFEYGLNLDFGLGQFFLIIAGGYAIYLNLIAWKTELKPFG